MNELEKHLNLFSPRLRRALHSFSGWNGIREIRLRRNLPLSLTSYQGNLFLSETGKISFLDRALRCCDEDLRYLVGKFCKGSVYRYFDTLEDGYFVDEDGWRLGLCPHSGPSPLLPEIYNGASLRIPRNVPGAAGALFSYFQDRPLASTLILSPPGDGKTTLLRSLAVGLSGGKHQRAFRVAVLDDRRELFPTSFQKDAGTCDVISGYSKDKGLEIAVRIFSPEVIVCDEIGNPEEAGAILRCANAGTLFFASAHGETLEKIRNRPGLRPLLEAGVFSYAATIRRIPGERFSSEILWEKIC